jgi:hypothetical protein
MGVPILGISGLQLGSHETKWHLGVGLVAKHKEYYKGEGGDFPQVWVMVSFVSPCLPVACPWTNYALTNLLFGLCRSVWVIGLLIILLSPYPRAPTCPCTPKVLWAKESNPTLHYSIVFTWDSHLSLLKNLGVRHHRVCLSVEHILINGGKCKGWNPMSPKCTPILGVALVR